MELAPRAAVYARKSLASKTGESIENQIRLCREFVQTRLPECTEVCVFSDEGFSGGDTDRPGFRQMLAEADCQPFRWLLCYRLDRISRSVRDFAKLAAELEATGTALISVTEGFGADTPTGRAMMYLASVFAQLERETIAERVHDNLCLLARTGRWLGGPRPTGFRPEPETVNSGAHAKTAFRLLPVEPELETVRTVYRIYLDCGSLSRTVRTLNEGGVRTRNGKLFSIPAVQQLLQNPVYAAAEPCVRNYFEAQQAILAFSEAECDRLHGLMPYNRTTTEQKRKIAKEISGWILAVGKHPAVLPGRDWVRVQQLLAQNRRV